MILPSSDKIVHKDYKLPELEICFCTVGVHTYVACMYDNWNFVSFSNFK